jgi:hypothetical protein
MTLGDEHGIEDIDLCLVDEEGFKQEGDYGGALAEDEHGRVEPGGTALPDG